MNSETVHQEKASLSFEGDVISFFGEVDQQDPSGFITPYLDEMMKQIQDEITLDFENCDFMNSSGIKCIVRFVLTYSKSHLITFKINSKKTWQNTSLKIVQTLAPEKVVISE